MEEKIKTENCMVCGGILDYLHYSENLTCTSCGKIASGSVICKKGHFVCDECHAGNSKDVILGLALTTTTQDPAEIAEQMMALPDLPMLGCEHAYVVAGAFMAALRNSPYGKGKITDTDVREVFNRTEKQALSGYCGLTGVCGIAPAIGACFSVFLGARCGTDSEQKITMEAVIRVSQAIADLTGPSCCEAYVRAALSTAASIFAERFGIMLPTAKTSIVCIDSARHPHGCREGLCPYYQKPARDTSVDNIHLPATPCRS
jgi:hypothetical protein